MLLIIAEKPSLARNIAAGIGEMKKRDGYFEGGGYLVTWAFGHLFQLYDVADYTGEHENTRWSMENLPFFPDPFRFCLRKDASGHVDTGVKKQFAVITALCRREDVTKIVNAGDADREGEIIVRLCIQNTGVTDKPLLRLWLPDQTPETVAQALKDLKSEDEYNSLAAEGFARTYMDWLYGVNLTRFASVKSGAFLRVGRVIVPIVKAIYDRDKAIESFVPDIYYALVSREQTNGETVELVSQYKFPKEKLSTAKRACDKLNAQTATVTKVTSRKAKMEPGKLYSLSKLQSCLGKKYKMSMEDSLRIVQKLYEDGYLTYPRTNSEYLATTEKDKIQKIVEKIKALGYPVKFHEKKTVFDDSKIESHSALTPTGKIPSPNDLTPEEKTVYSTVFKRFVAVFCGEECVTQKTEMTVSVGECEDYLLKGTVILEPGWTRFDDSAKNGKILPKLKKGDTVNIRFEPVQKQTSPPKHYTIETLNNYLKNPFREEKAAQKETEDDTEEYRMMFEGLELGTEATRTGIIGNAVKSGYIELKKDVYRILPDGEYLIRALNAMQINMDKYKTCALGQALKKVYRGESDIEGALDLAKAEIAAVFQTPVNQKSSEAYTGTAGEEIGVCPRCGSKILVGKYGYYCTGYQSGCKFKISSPVCSRVISVKEAQSLLTAGLTQPLNGFISQKTGKTFSARLKREEEKIIFQFDSMSGGSGNV